MLANRPQDSAALPKSIVGHRLMCRLRRANAKGADSNGGNTVEMGRGQDNQTKTGLRSHASKQVDGVGVDARPTSSPRQYPPQEVEETDTNPNDGQNGEKQPSDYPLGQ